MFQNTGFKKEVKFRDQASTGNVLTSFTKEQKSLVKGTARKYTFGERIKQTRQGPDGND